MPESDNERLTRRIQVKVPDLERENPRRNDALLSAIASGTGGKYYVGIQKAIAAGPNGLVEQLKDRTSTVILTAAPNPAVGRDVAALDDGRPVRLALFRVVDTTNREIGITHMSTTNLDDRPALSPSVQAVLGELRRRIRQYVWLEGCAAAVAWLGVAFWATLAVDWFFEPPVAVRGTMLALIVVVLAAVLLQLIGRRAFVRITDSNAAMVLERRFPQLGDSLLTAVTLAGRPTDQFEVDPQMLARTCREAAAHMADVDLKRVFNPQPLWLKLVAGGLLALSVAFFAAVFPDGFGVWARRTLALSDELWPRSTRLEVEGFRGGVRESCPRGRLGGRGPGRHDHAAGAASGRSPLSDRGRRPGPRHDGPARRGPRAGRQVPGICLHLPQRAGRRPLRRSRRRRPRRRPVDPSGR